MDAAGESGDASTLWVVHAVGKGLGKVSLQSESDPSKYLRLKEGVLDANGSKDPWSIFKVCAPYPLFTVCVFPLSVRVYVSCVCACDHHWYYTCIVCSFF